MNIHKKLLLFGCLSLSLACAAGGTKPVSFVIDPMTTEEKAIAQTLEGMINAFNDRNIDKFISYYAKEAKIESKFAGGLTSPEGHRAAIQRSLTDLPIIGLQKTKITILSADKSGVEADLRGTTSRGTEFVRVLYDLIQREGRWLVIEQTFPK